MDAHDRILKNTGGDVNNRDQGSAEVLTVGETMGCLLLPIESSESELTFIGAESNVAIGLAALGHNVRWGGRLGADRVGDYIVESLEKRGVRVDAQRDEDHSTGLAVKELSEADTTVRYYRRHSAAAAMDEFTIPRLAGERWLHVTGITPALSDDCRRALDVLVEDARARDVQISVDINLRSVLWPDLSVAASVMQDLVRHASVALIGHDESAALGFGDNVEAVQTRLPLRSGATLVFKRGAAGSQAWVDGQVYHADAAPARLLDVTGAGDAHAAGFISGKLRGLPTDACLRLGSQMAARVVGITRDFVDPIGEAEVARMVESV
jgi:2-dehydro-3-deoxygluconokinase